MTDASAPDSSADADHAHPAHPGELLSRARPDDSPQGPSEPQSPPDRVAVIGAGLAGLRTAAALRARGFQGHLTVVGAEPTPPYDRPPLSKELLQRTAPVWLADEGYGELDDLADVTLLGHRARRLDAGDHAAAVTITDDRGRARSIAADVVVLACGSTPARRVSGAGVLRLHTAQDAEALRRAIRPGVRLVCAGAGWIGAEVASVAVAAGARVTVVEPLSAPLVRQLGEEVGSRFSAWYSGAGVELRLGEHVRSIARLGTGGAPLFAVRTSADAELTADVVLDATGVRPATGWLAGSLPLTARGALAVDLAGRLPEGPSSVRAVGDCADRHSPRDGTVPGGHWDAALHHPDLLAADLLGQPHPEPADPAPYVFSTQFSHDVTVVGVPRDGLDVVYREDTSGWTALYLEHGSHGPLLRAGVTVDHPRDVGALRRALSATQAPVVDPRRIADAGVPLRRALAPGG